MKVYLHSDSAEKAARCIITIAPASDEAFVKPADISADWQLANGQPKQFEINFGFGVAEGRDDFGRYMVERGIAHRHRMLRKVRQPFDRFGKPLEEVFDERASAFSSTISSTSTARARRSARRAGGRATVARRCAIELALGNECSAGHSEIAAKLLADLRANFHVFSEQNELRVSAARSRRRNPVGLTR
jgi:hypothetical protein